METNAGEHEQTPEITVTQLPPDAGLDLLTDDSEDLLEEWSVPEAEDEQLDVDDEEDDDDEDDDEDAFDDIDGVGDPAFDALIGIAGQAGALMSAPSSETDERLRRLEAAARELAAAEVTRESRKVRRKVTAVDDRRGRGRVHPDPAPDDRRATRSSRRSRWRSPPARR